MIELFRRAVKDVISDNFGLDIGECERRPEGEGYTAVIPFREKDRQYEATIWAEPTVIKKLADILLEDPDPDENTRKDLTSELANFIVGHAKMLASDSGVSCAISTPRFSGYQNANAITESLSVRVGDGCLMIGIGDERG